MEVIHLILERAAALLTHSGGWTQNATARDAAGDELHLSTEPWAVCFCAGGAIHRAAADLGYDQSGDEFNAAVLAVAKAAAWDHVAGDAEAALEELIAWNDWNGRLQVDVVDLVRAGVTMVPA